MSIPISRAKILIGDTLISDFDAEKMVDAASKMATLLFEIWTEKKSSENITKVNQNKLYDRSKL